MMGSTGEEEFLQVTNQTNSEQSQDIPNHSKTNKSSPSAMMSGTKNGFVHRGPDMLCPADSFMTWQRDKAVKLQMASEGPLSIEPESIMTVFRRVVQRFPDNLALANKVDGQWQTLTFQEYYDLVIKAAKSFIKLGLEVYHGVGIIGFNSPEWFISCVGSIFAGGLATGIYATNCASACQAIAQSAECNVIVVENDHQLQKILKVRHQLPHLKAIVQYKGTPSADHPEVYSWSSFLEVGQDVSDRELDDRINDQSPNRCCSLIFTSGTTGNAKGAMLSHDNMIWTAKMAGTTVNWGFGCEVMISYLPLSHVAAQVVDIFVPLVYGASIYFAQPDALKGSLGETLKEVRPTSFVGVPRVWEKIQEKMTSVGKANSFLKRWIASWARDIGLRGNMALMNKGGQVPYGWMLADYLVFQSVRAALGFDRCRLCIVTAAPVMKDTLEFFMSLNIPLLEIYGLSECSGPHTFTTPWECRFASVGKGMGGCSTKVYSPDKDGCGELGLHGRNIFMGYLNDEVQTKAAIDEDGWFHSGDNGKIDEDGFVVITGRLKELLITAGGENVAPVPIEDAIKEQLPCISNCMVVGDRRKFLSVLITLKTELNQETHEPTDILSPSVLAWCKNVGANNGIHKISDIINRNDKKITDAIQEGLKLANQKAISRAQVVQKWQLLPRDFSIGSGELGPTMKLKRPVVCKMYQKEIDQLYASASGD